MPRRRAARRYFPAATIEAARQTLVRCIDRAEGVGLAIGPAGCGKSILCQVLAEQFRGRFLVALLASGRLDTSKALLQAILFELGLPYRGMDEGELRLSLVDHLTAQEANVGGLLLIVDEAHSLPPRLLGEIHQLTNLVRNGQPLVRVVLAGSAALEEHFGNSKLESFNQRIAGRCYLQAFKHGETLGYIRQAIAQAGGNADRIFTADALDAIHRATDGVPRLVNQLCDHALLLTFAAGVKLLTLGAIEEAWADLQQLPAPWNAAPGVENRPADIIEFGNLDEPMVAARLPADSEPPRLRTVGDDAGDDEGNLFTGEPSQRIERIQDQLGTIDEQFQPAGTIGPEVELVFTNAEINPFQEPFEEEEVIVDRFSRAVADPLAHAPLVRSQEGSELASLLAPHARAKSQHGKPPAAAPKKAPTEAAPQKATTESATDAKAKPPIEKAMPKPAKPTKPAAIFPPIVAPIDSPLASYSIEVGAADAAEPAADESLGLVAHDDWQETPAHELPGGMLPIARGWIHPSDDPVMPEEAGIDAGDSPPAEMQPTIRIRPNPSIGRSTPAIVRAPDPVEPDAIAQPTAAAANEVDDSDADMNDIDVIIVEDDPVPPPPTRPTTSGVRRQEYRQLFARLRRG